MKNAADRVLILGNAQEPHAKYVYEQLHHRGVATYFFDIQDFPKDVQINYFPETNQGSFIFGGDALCPFENIKAIYWRNYNRTPNRFQDPIPDFEMAYIAENDSRSLAESLLMGLETKWVNGWQAFELHQRKPHCLAKIARLGVRIPRTLCSNDPVALKDFFVREKNVIFKPIQGGTHTEVVRAEALTDKNLQGLELAPLTFQEEIRGTNIRAFVAGDRVISLEVKTHEIDFRDDPNPEIKISPMSVTLQEQSVKIARELGLLWTGIDYRLTPDGEYVFLEANPSPMFIGFEQRSGAPLTAALMDLLLS